jgi:hypothetical protein
MARQIADGRARGRSTVLGIGVDEARGIVIDRHGIGTLLVQWKGGFGVSHPRRGGTENRPRPPVHVRHADGYETLRAG